MMQRLPLFDILERLNFFDNENVYQVAMLEYVFANCASIQMNDVRTYESNQMLRYAKRPIVSSSCLVAMSWKI